MKRVLIRPSFHDWCGNRLFTQGTSHEGVYRRAFSLWREEARASGFAIDTWDTAPLREADVMWFLDLPPSLSEFCRIKSQLKPGCKLVLQILETPALSWNVFNPKNRAHFDCVVTYEFPPVCDTNPKVLDSCEMGIMPLRDNQFRHGQDAHATLGFPHRSQKTVHYHLPNTLRHPATNLPFHERKGLIALNSNRVEGIWGIRQTGLSGLPLVGKALSGWSFSFADLRQFLGGELYSARRNFLREADKTAPEFVDLYGAGWNGEQVSWCPLYPNRPYSCWRGKTTRPKDDLCAGYRFALAFENFRGNKGYVSEKIFDAFSAGTVPVYLGEERIAELVPPESFVDARNFSGFRELLLYLNSCIENEWSQMREAGQRHLSSEVFQKLTDATFSKRMMESLLLAT